MLSNDQFDRNFRSMQKRTTTLFGVFGIVWVIMFVLSLGLLGTLIYVACHFLAKVW